MYAFNFFGRISYEFRKERCAFNDVGTHTPRDAANFILLIYSGTLIALYIRINIFIFKINDSYMYL